MQLKLKCFSFFFFFDFLVQNVLHTYIHSIAKVRVLFHKCLREILRKNYIKLHKLKRKNIVCGLVQGCFIYAFQIHTIQPKKNQRIRKTFQRFLTASYTNKHYYVHTQLGQGIFIFGQAMVFVCGFFFQNKITLAFSLMYTSLLLNVY